MDYSRRVPSTPLTPTSYVVLGLTELLGAATPYEMEQWVETSLAHFWSFPRSQLYSEPARLAAAGLLDEEREQTGRRRRRFTLRPEEGRAALQEWLAVPDGRGSEIRDLGLLRLFFGSVAADPADVREGARAQASTHAAQLEAYRELQYLDLEPHVAATLRLGVAYEQAAVAFWQSVADGGVETGPT